MIEERGYSIDTILQAGRFALIYSGYELAKLKVGDTVVVVFATGV